MYVKDARARALPLSGGEDVTDDWNWLLRQAALASLGRDPRQPGFLLGSWRRDLPLRVAFIALEEQTVEE